jgi:hypothetical protein
MVWGIMKRQMTWDDAIDQDQAKSKLIALWEAIPYAILDALCQSFSTRVKMVRDAVGHPLPTAFVESTIICSAELLELRAAVEQSRGRNLGRMGE